MLGSAPDVAPTGERGLVRSTRVSGTLSLVLATQSPEVRPSGAIRRGAPEFFGVLPLMAVGLFAVNNGILKHA